VEYSPDEEATAQRILTSVAIKDSALPEQFLRHNLAGAGHAMNFTVLEQIVYATSKTGGDGATDPNAVLAPRPRERFAAMQAAGEILTPEQARNLMKPTSSNTKGTFDDYAPRIKTFAAFLTTDKKALGSLYAATAEKCGTDSQQMKNVDKLARALATLRATGQGTEDDKPGLLDLLNPPDQDQRDHTPTGQPTPHERVDVNA
jgi:hypothetical protein